MKALIENAAVVELNQVPNKDGKVYPRLLIVELGQQYPTLKSINVPLSDAMRYAQHVGQTCDITVDIREYSGRNSYNILSIKAVQAQKAA